MTEPPYPIRVKNVSGEEMPPYAICVLKRPVRQSNSGIVYEVEKVSIPPTIAGKQILLVNSAKAVDNQKTGWARLASARIGWVRFNVTGASADIPFGEIWGVQDDSWELNKNKAGFEIVGMQQEDRHKIVAQYIDSPRYYFELTAALSAPANMETTPTTVTATLFKSSLTSSSISAGQTVTLQNRWEDLELDSAKRGRVEWDWTLMEYVIYATECP